MGQLANIIERIQSYLEIKNTTRDQLLARSRELTRYCANAIRALHRAEYQKAVDLLSIAREAVQRMVSDLTGHPDLYYSGYTQDALKEWTEACITYAFITDKPLPTPEELNVLPATYLNGLGEAMGELRRHILDAIRHGEIERCERLLQAMEEVYSALVTIDYPEAVTAGLRHTTDMVRSVLERTRGDLTIAARQEALQRALSEFELKTLQRTDSTSAREPVSDMDNA